MPSPHTFKFVRQSVPVPIEALDAIDALAAVTGRSRAHIIADLLLDAAPIARSMATQIAQIKGGHESFIRRVLALSESVTSATNDTLKGPNRAGVPLAGAPARGGGETFSPSSNTGKVPRRPKNLGAKIENQNRLADVSHEVEPIQNR